MGYHGAKNSHSTPTYKPTGRFPANFIHDGSEEVLAIFPDTTPSKAGIRNPNESNLNCYGKLNAQPELIAGHEDAGGSASRFFYCAKASKQDREEGLEGFEDKEVHRFGQGLGEGLDPDAPAINKNHHPTVKPVDLMRYLCRLVTPTGELSLILSWVQVPQAKLQPLKDLISLGLILMKTIARFQRPELMKQSRFMSWLEAMMNTIIGFGLSIVIQMVFYPLMDIQTTPART